MLSHHLNEIVKLKMREIRTKLEKKQHGDKYTGPQYTLWAKFIRMGHHDSYDDPPSIPLMTGEQKGQSKKSKESVSDALAGAATAIANAITGKAQPASSPEGHLRTLSLLVMDYHHITRQAYGEASGRPIHIKSTS